MVELFNKIVDAIRSLAEVAQKHLERIEALEARVKELEAKNG